MGQAALIQWTEIAEYRRMNDAAIWPDADEDTGTGSPMSALVNYLVSYLRREKKMFMNTSHGSSADQIIAGYCLPGISDEIYTPDRKPGGILYADVVDYARLSEDDSVEARARLFESMEIFRSKITANLGRIAHFTGDAILAEFEDTDSALNCAIQVQLSARQRNATLALSRQVKFRIGVSSGESIFERGDIPATAAMLASSLAELACAGGICVSKNLHSMSETGSSIRFVATGKRFLKDTSRVVDTFWILIDSDRIDSQSVAAQALHRPAEVAYPIP